MRAPMEGYRKELRFWGSKLHFCSLPQEFLSLPCMKGNSRACRNRAQNTEIWLLFLQTFRGGSSPFCVWKGILHWAEETKQGLIRSEFHFCSLPKDFPCFPLPHVWTGEKSLSKQQQLSSFPASFPTDFLGKLAKKDCKLWAFGTLVVKWKQIVKHTGHNNMTGEGNILQRQTFLSHCNYRTTVRYGAAGMWFCI